MLYDWSHVGRAYRLFRISERWGIRQHTVTQYMSVVLHRCDDGGLGAIHNLHDGTKCKECKTPVPDEIQALWFLQNWGRSENQL